MEVGIFEARNRFSELVEAAEAGEDIVVLRRGKPVIRLVPVVDREALAQRRLDALEKIKAISAEITRRNGRPFTHAELMAARDEGKR
jgi:prevent-host-death family protein